MNKLKALGLLVITWLVFTFPISVGATLWMWLDPTTFWQRLAFLFGAIFLGGGLQFLCFIGGLLVTAAILDDYWKD